MIQNYSPLIQTLLGTSLTWFVTAFGALFCFIISNHTNKLQHQLLDGSLGFSAGIMLAASFWSLLDPALEMAKMDLEYGIYGVVPVSLGFIFGAIFVGLTEYFLPTQWFQNSDDQCKSVNTILKKNSSSALPNLQQNNYDSVNENDGVRRRNKIVMPNLSNTIYLDSKQINPSNLIMTRRLWLLLIAITVHNIPEGLAVGIAFGGIGQFSSATFSHASNLAIGIAIQNFPEGLAVSLPLYSSGYGFWKSFWYGQLSGLVEPFSGLIGCLAVQFFRKLQPYALGLAAGAMFFVVFDDVIPESHSRGNGHLSSIFAVIGFIIMMCLDVITTP